MRVQVRIQASGSLGDNKRQSHISESAIPQRARTTLLPISPLSVRVIGHDRRAQHRGNAVAPPLHAGAEIRHQVGFAAADLGSEFQGGGDAVVGGVVHGGDELEECDEGGGGGGGDGEGVADWRELGGGVGLGGWWLRDVAVRGGVGGSD